MSNKIYNNDVDEYAIMNPNENFIKHSNHIFQNK